MVLHQIARTRSQHELIEWGINTILSISTPSTLQGSSRGALFSLTVACQPGPRLPQEKVQGRRRRAFVDLSAGPDSSVRIDLRWSVAPQLRGGHCLGAFRYCVNREHDSSVVRELLPKVMRLMWHRREGDVLYLRDYGLALRPNNVVAPSYRRVRRPRYPHEHART